MGRPLCVYPFSGVVVWCACDVAFFIGAAGEVIVRMSLLLFLVSGDVARDIGCLFALFLNISFFYAFHFLLLLLLLLLITITILRICFFRYYWF